MKLLLFWRVTLALALGVVLALLGFMPADAADVAGASINVAIPWGDWAASLLANFGSVIGAAAVYVIGKWAPAYVKSVVTEATITQAVHYGLAAVEGAAAGKTLTVETTNAVLTAAIHYAVQVEPAAAKWAGGNLAPMLLSRLGALGTIPASVSAAGTGATLGRAAP